MSEGSRPYFISAGEPSGDLLAADLVHELKNLIPLAKASGVAGPMMRRAGVEAFADIDQLSVMGFVEIIRHIPRLKRLETMLLRKIEQLNPRFAIIVDYPGFHLRLAGKLKEMGIPVFMYVAPQLWAWGENRTSRLKRVTDKVLGIVPFEEKFFLDRDVNYTYVGTPQMDRVAKVVGSRSDFCLPSDKRVYGIFPGSRTSEIERILPTASLMIAAIKQQDPNAHFAISVATSVPCDIYLRILIPSSEEREKASRELQLRGFYQCSITARTLVLGRSLDLMALCDAALVTSGTATLECALVGTPLAVIYIANRITYMIGKRLIRQPFISLVNLVAEEKLVEEFVQDIHLPDLAQQMIKLAQPSTDRLELTTRLIGLRSRLKANPGFHAAHELTSFMRQLDDRGA